MAERLLADVPDQKHVLRRAWPHLRHRRAALARAVAVNLASAAAFALVPVLIGRVVDRLLAGDRTGMLALCGGVLALVLAPPASARAEEPEVTGYALGSLAARVLARDAGALTTVTVAAAPLSADGRHGYVAAVDGHTIQVFDAATFQVTATVPTGDSPTSIAVAPDGRRAYVTNLRDGTLTVLDVGR